MNNNYDEKELNEKECPYCGGGVEFSIYDKIIVCPYCGKNIDVSMFNPETIIRTKKKYYDVKGKTNVVSMGGILSKKDIIVLIIVIALVIIGVISFAINMKRDFDIKSKYEEISSKNIDYVFLNELHEKSKKKIEEESKNLSTFSVSSSMLYKSFIFNSKKIDSEGYSRENVLYDILKVTYSDGKNQFDVYQCVNHSGIKIKNSVVSFDDDVVSTFLQSTSLGILEKGTFDDLKVSLNDNEYVYGTKDYNELYNHIMKRKEWDKWNYYSMVELDR